MIDVPLEPAERLNEEEKAKEARKKPTHAKKGRSMEESRQKKLMDKKREEEERRERERVEVNQKEEERREHERSSEEQRQKEERSRARGEEKMHAALVRSHNKIAEEAQKRRAENVRKQKQVAAKMFKDLSRRLEVPSISAWGGSST